MGPLLPIRTRSMPDPRLPTVGQLAGVCALACTLAAPPAAAYFQLNAPLRFRLDGSTIRFDEIGIAETVVPCERSRARLKLQVRATREPYQPPTDIRTEYFQPYQTKADKGTLLVEHDLGQVSASEVGCSYEAFDVALPITPPPPGRYYLSVFLFAYPTQNNSWCIDFRYCFEDWHAFPDTVTFGAAVPASPAKP